MKKLFLTTIMLVLISDIAFAFRYKGSVGGGLGANMTFLVSDVLASGIGSQYSLYASLFRDHPTALKVRLDMVKSREESMVRSKTDYLAQGSVFRSAEQNWTLLTFNAEKEFKSRNRVFFWEAGLGYGFGRGGLFRAGFDQLDSGNSDFPVSQGSGFILHGGLGAKKSITPKITANVDIRTFFLLRTVYNQDPWAQRQIYVFPILLNLSVEYDFDIGK